MATPFLESAAIFPAYAISARWILKGYVQITGLVTIERISTNRVCRAAVTRARGTEVPGVVRKGAVGEWRTSLSKTEEQETWGIAGDMLTEFGYEQDGKVKADFPAV